MMTGDKFETAENVATSCRLINPLNHVIRLKTLSEFNALPAEVFGSIIIEGSVVEHIMSDQIAAQRFMKASLPCQAIICCRLTPKQKADLVHLYKNAYPMRVTAAIGDGANDVPMLREAHVGIGIYGQEGMQAAQSSEFAIG